MKEFNDFHGRHCMRFESICAERRHSNVTWNTLRAPRAFVDTR